MVIYDRGIASAENIRETRKIGWDTLCGLPIRGKLADVVRKAAQTHCFVQLDHRVRLRKNVFYAVGMPHTIEGVKGTLTVCFNDRQQRDLRESRYDEIEQAQRILQCTT